ncbi:TrbI/VirB10 family protein [Escherichia coli]|uniref:TrbI/VirB10 family protein n=1 Tax=Escherichia coli TaxID=562 RepID=UPI0024333DA5|nr:TrbI/VirB10 family protein [Escherichia coli]MDG5898307.1 TrbI/VirB10 family protein [Escherichia coli]
MSASGVKNGIKGEVVMRNGKILGWAWGAGFVDGIGREWSAPPSRLSAGCHSRLRAGDVLKMGIGGGASKAAQTLSDYYIKRAEQYHPVIPIGAGNEVTVVFQDGFQLKTVEKWRWSSHRVQRKRVTRKPCAESSLGRKPPERF